MRRALVLLAVIGALGWAIWMTRPPIDGRTTAEDCDAGGGIWDAHHSVCHDDDTAPRALDMYHRRDRPQK